MNPFAVLLEFFVAFLAWLGQGLLTILYIIITVLIFLFLMALIAFFLVVLLGLFFLTITLAHNVFTCGSIIGSVAYFLGFVVLLALTGNFLKFIFDEYV